MTKSNDKNVYEILGRHPVHPFPARMAPSLALDVIAERKGSLHILDPMAGSGTVLAVAHSKGHRATGFDLDPLAVLISRVWTTAIDPGCLRDAADSVLVYARQVFSSLPTRDSYPTNADFETRRFIRYWFDAYARKQLASLAIAIQQVNEDTIRDALWCAFSRLIITKQAGASLAMDLSHSRPHRKFIRAPVKPFRKFLSAVERVVVNCIDNRTGSSRPNARVDRGDARALPQPTESIDLLITSPPYLNAIDYLRCSKFSLVWMGYSIEELRQVRAKAIGTEVGLYPHDDTEIQRVFSALKIDPKLPQRQEALLARYIHDIRAAVREAARVLTKKGQAVYVVGENTIRGSFIPNAKIVEAVAHNADLRCTARRSRELPPNRRYLPPPSILSGTTTLRNRFRREVILTLSKA